MIALPLVILLLAGFGAYELFNVQPTHILITVAVVGVVYHLAVALIYRYVWPRK